MKTVDGLATKFQKFKKELNERKVLPLISDALDAVEKFSKKVKEAEACAKGLAVSGLEDQSVASITEAIEAMKKVLGEASASGNDARTTAQKKQRESGAGGHHPSIVQMNQDLHDGSEKLRKLGDTARKAEVIVKVKNALTSGEEKAKEAETVVAKTKTAAPTGDFTVETVASFDEACSEAMKALRALSSVVQPVLGSASAKAKPELEKLMVRRKEMQATVDELKTANKEKREAALSAHYIAEAETETPFLIGTPMGSSKATQEILNKCAEAAKEVVEAIKAAKTFISSKTGESTQFGEAALKNVKESLGKMTERLQKVSSKHTAFEKDSLERAKECRMVEASERTDEFEALVKKTIE